ncbi:MAG: fimbrillin family protein [Mediterranea sp.]|jgi:hypothetical protein|nr:fimbrillin family protein [Mediterranea sp.]
MRTFKPWLLLGTLLGIAAGCDRMEETSTHPSADNGDVSFVLNIEEPTEANPLSRVNTSTDGNFTTTWQDGDKVGVYVVNYSTGAPALKSNGNFIDNRQLTYSNGKWVLAGEKITFPSDGTKLAFYAYFPYQENLADALHIPYQMAADQSVAGKEYDFLVAAPSKVEQRGGQATLVFSHKVAIAQVQLGVQGNAETADQFSNVSIPGVLPNFYVSMADGKVTEAAGGTAVTAKYQPMGKGLFRLYLPPQTRKAGTMLVQYDYNRVAQNGKPLDADVAFAGGTAYTYSENMPAEQIKIGTLADFQKIGFDDKFPLSGNYLLMANLDAKGTSVTLGKKDTIFTGTFDGGGKSIKNLKIEASGWVGTNRGTIKNLTLQGSVTGVQRAGGFAGNNSGTIDRCVSQLVVKGTSYVGGIAGDGGGRITNCLADVSAAISSTYFAGGIIGSQGGGYVGGCWSAATVSGYQYVGAVSGSCNGGVIEGSAADRYAVVNGTGSSGGRNIGGLVGNVSSNGRVSGCYSCAAVNSANQSTAGILVGSLTRANTYSNYYTPGGTVGDKAVGSWSEMSDPQVVKLGNGWPDATKQGWEVGPDKYWQSLGSWNNGNPLYPRNIAGNMATY